MRTFGKLLIFAALALYAGADEESAKRRVTELGGKTFVRKGEVVEVVLNGAPVEDKGLAALLAFPALTDLSLENTRAGDADMAHLAKLPKLEWLNLYRTWVGDLGARSLAQSKSLRMLPIGET
ncbi:MAG: hypothetical protein AAEJ57_03125, partial [Opitutales bacterium]